ncbi:MAG: PA14 domain-containing protein [Anaerolineae bacterium]
MKTKIALFSVFVIASLFLVGTQPAHAVEVWQAKYWNNRTLEGDPVIVRNESGLSHEWGDGSPDASLDTDAFSAEWSTTTRFNAGTYRFTATVDDGMRVYVDGNKIIDVWYDSQQHDVSADVNLSEGNHSIVVKYYEAGGKAVAKITWAQVSSSAVTASGLWTAEYFNNTSLSGSPTRTQSEGKIDYIWGGSPAVGINADQFSARWSGVVPVDSGTYRFTVRADDGARLWVNGNRIIDQWREQGATTFSADIALNGGSVPVTLEYFDQGGTGEISLNWTKISSTTIQQTTTSNPTITEWKGEYYNNINLANSPVLTRNDANLNFNWGSSSPVPNVVNHDLFSVRWTRKVNLNGGTYSFKTVADDGVRVWVNDQLIIDHWTTAKGEALNGTVSVPGGATNIRVEYFELTGLAEARLEWDAVNPNINPTPTPTSTTVTNPPTTANSTAPEGYAVLKNARVLTMRSGPGMEFRSVGFIDRSTTPKLIGRSSGGFWIKVLCPDGTLGWAASRYLSSPTDFSTLPIVN